MLYYSLMLMLIVCLDIVINVMLCTVVAMLLRHCCNVLCNVELWLCCYDSAAISSAAVMLWLGKL